MRSNPDPPWKRGFEAMAKKRAMLRAVCKFMDIRVPKIVSKDGDQAMDLDAIANAIRDAVTEYGDVTVTIEKISLPQFNEFEPTRTMYETIVLFSDLNGHGTAWCTFLLSPDQVLAGPMSCVNVSVPRIDNRVRYLLRDISGQKEKK